MPFFLFCILMNHFVLGFTFLLLTFTFSIVVCTASEVVGASQPIVTAQGDDVILPCHVEPQLDVEDMTVEWWRPDLPPDPADPLSNYRYVHRYHDKRHEEDMKNLSYAGRTEMSNDGLRHGNISLKIRDVRRSDRGRYRCQVLHLASAAVIMLHVEPASVETTLRPGDVQTPDPSDGTDAEGGGLFVSVLIGGLAASVLLILAVGCLLHQNQHSGSNSSSSGSEQLGS